MTEDEAMKIISELRDEEKITLLYWLLILR